MIENIIARRYARGLADLAVERQELDSVREELALLVDLLSPGTGDFSVPELGDFLASPTVAKADKIRVTDVVCEKTQLGKTVSDFLNVLINSHRVPLIGLIGEEYELIVAVLNDTKTASVESAQALTTEQEARLRKELQESIGGKVEIFVKVNPDLLAGIRVRIGDMVLDGSLRSRLTRLSAQLTQY